MKMSGRSQWLIMGIAAAAAAGACARTHPTTTVSTAGGEVAIMDGSGGMWLNGERGIWMDTTGVLRVGGRSGMLLGLGPREVAMMSDRNILAHVRADDSLEVVLSRLGVTSATNSNVRDFAQDMVADHTSHLDKERKLSTSTGIAPVTWRPDSTDQIVASHLMTGLSRAQAGPSFDRQFMGSEVMMHRHMLHDLQMFQAQAAGPSLDFVNSTITVVQRHLKDALMVQSALGPKELPQ